MSENSKKIEIIAFTKQRAGFFKIEWRDPHKPDKVYIERRRMSVSTNSPGQWRGMCIAQFGLDPLLFAEGKRVSRDLATGMVDMPRHFGEARGRPPKGKVAQSDAERMRAYRQRKKEQGK